MKHRPRPFRPPAPAALRVLVALVLATLGACSLTEEPAPAPVAAPEVITRLAVGSCADQKLPQPIWEAVLGYRPEAFVFMGDNVYGDVTSAELTELRAAYDAARRIPGYQRVRSLAYVLPIWDDHDYGLNDGGAAFPHRDGAKELFLDFWSIGASDARRARPGLYHAEIIGPPGRRVQIILLDTRWFRSPLKPTDRRGQAGRERYLPDPDPAKTMLGPEQWAWLAEELRKPAEVRLVVSSIQVLADGHGWERWGNLPLERERLIALVRETAANGVVFLSGDRHIGAFYRQTRGAPYPLYEMTSSSLNRPFRGASERDPRRLGPLYDQENFGTVTIDWDTGVLTLELRDLQGQTVAGHAVGLAVLQAPRAAAE